jgi:hypothetical protein
LRGCRWVLLGCCWECRKVVQMARVAII